MVRNATAPVFADPALAGNGEHHHTRGLGIAYYERYALKLLRGDFRNAGAHDALADAEFMDLEIGCRAE